MRVFRLVDLLPALHQIMLRTFPPDFRTEFGEEMVEVFRERLATAEDQGTWAVVVLGGQELGQMPRALLGLHRYLWQKKRQQFVSLFSRISGHAVFGVPPVDNDGRFSRLQQTLEMIPFLLTATLILLLTYRPPAWLPSGWHDPLDMAAAWAGALPLLALLLGLACGMPRWAYPYAGLVTGYTLWAAAEQRLVWLWVLLLATIISLVMMAVVVHRGKQPLPTFFQRLGASVILDWTRLSFGAFGAAPLFILAAFDNAYLNWRTPYLALVVLLMVLTALLYGRCRRQDVQLAIILGGTTLLFVPAILDHTYSLGRVGDIGWLLALWASMMTLMLLPVLSVPVQWASINLLRGLGTKE